MAGPPATRPTISRAVRREAWVFRTIEGEWIDQYLAAHAAYARAVSTLGLTRLEACFPQELVARAKVVSVEQVPFPPVEKFGLPELAGMQHMSFDGMTFKDTFFLRQGQISEALHFHEMVHVVHWARLGVDNFILAYGLGLISFGYERSPPEQMAYNLQRSFELGSAPPNLVGIIEQGTDAIWKQAEPIIRGTG